MTRVASRADRAVNRLLSLLVASARDRFPVHLDLTEVNIAARAVAAARHQIRKADFIDLAEVRIGLCSVRP